MPQKSQPSTCTGQCSSPVEMLGLAASSHLLPNSSGSQCEAPSAGGYLIWATGSISHFPSSHLRHVSQLPESLRFMRWLPSTWWLVEMEMECNLAWLAGLGGWGDAGLKLLSDCSLSGSARRRRQRVGSSRTDFLPGRAFYRVWAMHLTLSTG